MSTAAHNLSGSTVAHAPVPSQSSSKISGEAPSHLTLNGIYKVKDFEAQKLHGGQNLILQALQVKIFDASEVKNKIRGKVTLSDGATSIRCLLTDGLYKKLAKEPKVHDIVKVDSFQKTAIQGQTILVIKDGFEVIVDKVEAKIGAPIDFAKAIENPEAKEAFTIPKAAAATVNFTPNPDAIQEKRVSAPPKAEKPAEPVVKELSVAKEEGINASSYMPIKAINTFSRDWVIKARLAKKSDLRPTKKGGYILKLELVDNYGTSIEGVFFGDAAKHFHQLLKENDVYTFSGGQVKMANKKFTSINNDYNIVFEKHSKIEKAKDDGTILAQAFDFHPISSIEETQDSKSIDILGVVTEVGEAESIPLRNQGGSRMRRQVEFADDSEAKVTLTLWGDSLCTKHNLKAGELVAVKNARVSKFGGRSLNASGESTQLFLNNDPSSGINLMKTPEGRRMLKWIDSLGGSFDSTVDGFKGLTAKPQSKYDKANKDEKSQKQSNLNLISEVEALSREQSDFDQAQFFFLNGTVQRVNEKSIFYPACKTERCNRKVIEEFGNYKCEHCNMQFSDFVPTYFLTAQVADFSGAMYVSFSRDQATKIMGKTATEFMKFQEQATPEEMTAYFDSLKFNRFNIMVKAKQEMYMGESKMKFQAVRVFKPNVQLENKALLQRLAIYTDKTEQKEQAYDFGGEE
mmetsp:Transcript_12810/g.19843  ORF Transcript_12810/g.19843 Transcript_12810/m.19843 type:complete len:687 (-) Transcript_12810:51-2111(-)